MICILKKKNLEGNLKRRKCQNCNGDKKNCIINYNFRNTKPAQLDRSGGGGSPTRTRWAIEAYEAVRNEIKAEGSTEQQGQKQDFYTFEATEEQQKELDKIFKK